MIKKPAFFQTRTRYCVRFDEESLSFLRRTAGLQEDETVLMLIDDSMRAQRTKNVVFTDRRILWQEKLGAPYKELLLESLNGSSVFATSCGFNPIITVLNGGVCVSFRFKNIMSCDALRIVFHDYLSRHCADYIPFGAENEARYKKEVLAPLKHKRITSTFFAVAGVAALILFSITDATGYHDAPMKFMLSSAIVFWGVNILLPASKSKLSKTFFLFLFIIYAFNLSHFMVVTLFDKIVCLACATAFLRIELFETDGYIKVTSTYIAVLALLFAIAMIIF